MVSAGKKGINTSYASRELLIIGLSAIAGL